MLTREGESAYRFASAQGATQLGLMKMLYSATAADLARAGQAAEAGKIKARCDASNHALLLLGHLEGWADSAQDAELAESLKSFYGFVRSRLLVLQAKGKGADFEALASLLLQVKAAWEQKEQCFMQELSSVSPSLPSSSTEKFFDEHTKTVWCA